MELNVHARELVRATQKLIRNATYACLLLNQLPNVVRQSIIKDEWQADFAALRPPGIIGLAQVRLTP